jgi:hypothetical protein
MIAMYDGLSSDTTGLNPYPMGVLIFSVVAHAGLFPARNITAGELRKIFAKPGEQGIVAVGRRAGSGSRKAFVRMSSAVREFRRTRVTARRRPEIDFLSRAVPKIAPRMCSSL